MISVDFWMGLFLLLTSLFTAVSAVFLLDLVSQGRKARGPVSPFASNGSTGLDLFDHDPDQRGETQAQLPVLPDSALQQQRDDLQQVADASPLLTWRENSAGAITWSNRAYHDLYQKVHQQPFDAAEHFKPLFAAPEAGKPSQRQAITLPDRKDPLWFEKYTCPLEAGTSLHFALNADPVVRAEEALRNFVQTLTKTFAHLPIGLAIFDRNRQLALFNLALADLTTLDPEWLSDRPTLYTFLDHLRERRQLPKPKDFNSWRDRFTALERAAEDGTFEEHWPLPTGQTFKVTGRPHPEGAVAFLFEDITAAISLQRHFRAELELGQAVLDGMPDALAVFSADGELVMSNDAFTELWGVEPREMLARMTLDDAVDLWQGRCQSSPIWKQLRDGTGPVRPTQGVTSGRSRVPWGGQIAQKTGLDLTFTIRPLSRGATLCSFGPARISALPLPESHKHA